MTVTKNPHIGSSFDDFLEEEGILAETSAVAIKRVIAWEISQEMANQGITKKAMAEQMHTSRTSVDRLLDPDNTSITLNTMERAAVVVGKQLKLELVDVCQ
jgi:antitoxin HicB